jgi:subtilase family serine protease
VTKSGATLWDFETGPLAAKTGRTFWLKVVFTCEESMYVTVDRLNQVVESNETNNQTSAPFVC